jgi:hypothetical protein
MVLRRRGWRYSSGSVLHLGKLRIGYFLRVAGDVYKHMLNGKKTSDDMMGGLVDLRASDERLVDDIGSGCHFRSGPPPLLSVVKDLRTQNRMGIDEPDPEVGFKGIVPKSTVLGEYQVPSKIDEHPA